MHGKESSMKKGLNEEEKSKQLKNKEGKSMNKKRVCIYCRAGSGNNKDKEKSIATQEQIAMEYVGVMKNWEVVDIIHEQKSGASISEHPKCEKMINDALSGRYDILVFKDFTKISRIWKEILVVLTLLVERNVDIISTYELEDFERKFRGHF